MKCVGWMSLHEARALPEGSVETKTTKTRSGKAVGVAMNEGGSLKRQKEQLRADLEIANEELVNNS